ncbi:DUF3072 domain-containing protein [Pelagovum pacificum]|nr:DUF3072 domain-containing protein [Pelagovum pacificum]QQA43305.1 DUF3072 domain-containing protein [Pelagovum pacificum]
MIPPVKPLSDELTPDNNLDDDAPMTEEQAAQLRDLCDRAGEPMDANLTQMQAQKRIAALQEVLGE